MIKLETNLDPKELSKNPEEFKRFLVAIDAMELYSYHNYYWQIDKLYKDFSSLDKKYLEKMTYDYGERGKRLEDAIGLNQYFLNEIAQLYKPDSTFYGKYDMKEIDDLAYNEYGTLNYAVFMYISRDWTIERKKERETNYMPIIEMAQKYVPKNSKILIPGAALLRLGYELALLGYNIDANDYNFFNVILCDYLFNKSKKNQFEFQPLIRSFSNYLTEDAVFRKFSFPDEDINLDGKGKMTMLVGDFTKIYNDKPCFYDCVITCFLLIQLKMLWNMLKLLKKF